MKINKAALVYFFFLFLSFSVNSCEIEPYTTENETIESGDDVEVIDSNNGDESNDDESNDDESNDDEQVADQNLNTTIEIALWKGFKEVAISHTWDDSSAGHIDLAIPIFDSFNLKTTLFTLPNNVRDWNKYKEASANGHEIASHSISHPSFANINQTLIEQELQQSQLLINQFMNFDKCLTFAYPFCATEDFNLTEKYYIAARSCTNKIEKSTPEDFFKVNAILSGGGSAYTSSDDLNQIAQNALTQNGWAVYLFHAIGEEANYLRTNDLNKHLQFLADESDIFWVDTFLNVIKYIKERNSAKIDISIDDNIINIHLSDQLNNNIFNFPLTLKKEVPTSWVNDNIEVMQNGSPVEFNLISGKDFNSIIFNAIPDSGTISIAKK